MFSKFTGRLALTVLLPVLLLIAAGCAAPPSNLPPADLSVTPPAESEDAAAEPASAATESAEQEEEPAQAGAADDGETETEADQETVDGVPVGFTEEGFPYKGNLDAPITVHEFSDYECPFCARHVIQTEPALEDSYLADGDVRFVFHDFPIESIHPNATTAHIAARCVGEQGAAVYWRMHDLLFRTQSEWAPLDDGSDVFTRLAEDAGADVAAYEACYADAEDIRAEVEASVAEGQGRGFTGTPTFSFVREETDERFTLVGAQPYNVFADYLDTIAEGGTPVDPAAAQQQQQGAAEIPFWATEEGLAPDPDNEGLTVAGDYWRGNPDAPVVVMEFSDFQCPYCRQHTLQTQPVLDEQFIKPGDVMWVFKHFPVESSHPQAFTAAIAAECAGEQGMFWEMHDLLFERVEEWSNNEAEEVLRGLAEEIGLDAEVFASCQAEDETRQKVEEDLFAGSPFVRGTPTFVVLYGGQGQLIPGALPADQFTQALDELLADAASGE